VEKLLQTWALSDHAKGQSIGYLSDAAPDRADAPDSPSAVDKSVLGAMRIVASCIGPGVPRHGFVGLVAALTWRTSSNLIVLVGAICHVSMCASSCRV
jgi:hypothetical protein